MKKKKMDKTVTLQIKIKKGILRCIKDVNKVSK